MKILLISPPFGTPVSTPYSLSYLAGFLKGNSTHEIEVLDLNLEFHNRKFSSFKKNLYDAPDVSKFIKESALVYSENNKGVVSGKSPEYFDEFVTLIKEKKPDVVAFSVVYSSQAFYTYALLKVLDMITIIGGPAVNNKIIPLADHHFPHEIAFLEFLENKKIAHDKLNFHTTPAYDMFPLQDYFIKEPVIPLKTSTTCYYKRCTYCSHYSNVPYIEYPLEDIKKTVEGHKYLFVIDDMIPVGRLRKLSEVLKDKIWTCQLKPKAFSSETLNGLYSNGLRMIMWGVESGSDRVLGLMDKGTNTKEVAQVLKDSHNAGIKNVAYVMFGFPGETKEEFLETIKFLETNSEYIDLVSTSIFGLQRGTIVYNNPERFGVTIQEIERTVLEPRVTYSVSSGLTHEKAIKLRSSYKRTIEKINKFPKWMNYFREWMLEDIS